MQRHRIRASLLRVDPWGVRFRFRQVLHRREYCVSMANSLWHIDGYHKFYIKKKHLELASYG